MKARNIIAYSTLLFLPTKTFMGEPNFTLHQNVYEDNPHKVGYIFAHGLGATQEQSLLYLPTQQQQEHWIITKPFFLFDFHDAKNNNMEYYGSKVNLGQELDIERLFMAHIKAGEMLPDHKFVLSGISRGAATIINYVALQEQLLKLIAALVLESPFDTFTNVIKHLLRRFHVSWFPFSKKIALRIAKKNFPLLNLNGIFPIKTIQKIPHHIPTLISHSRRDRTIPINSSRNLYKAAALSGNPHVYLFEIASGDHGRIVQGPEGNLYVEVVHAFYKKYNLPHHAALAQRGEAMLKHCQPTIVEVNKRIKKTRSLESIYDEEEEMYSSDVLDC